MVKSVNTIQVRAVAFQEGDVWVVQGVEYDVVAQTRDPLDAPAAFLRALCSTLMINMKLGRSGFDRLKAAPTRFSEMFENASQLELRAINEVVASVESLPKPDLNLRLYRGLAA